MRTKLFSLISLLTIIVFIKTDIVYAATTPSLGQAESFGILSSTYTNTVAGTTITGDLGYTTGPAMAPTLVGSIFSPPSSKYSTAGTDQSSAKTNLDGQACTHTFPGGAIDLATDTSHGTLGVYTPGVYCTAAASAASIGAGGITLSGSGTYIFRITGALTTVANSVVTLSGASACDVFWTPAGATTLGANSTFKGTDIDASGITIGSTVNWTGRALSYGGTVSTDADTITVPTCGTALSVSASVDQQVTCFGLSDGQATAMAIGGTAPYTYSWNSSPVKTTAIATGLASGSYTVTVTDSASNTATASATITQPTVLSVSVTGTDPTTHNGTNGQASTSVSGGTTPYTYLWNDSLSQTTATATNLVSGSYSVTVTDNNSCTKNGPVTLSNPAASTTTTSSTSTTTSSTSSTEPPNTPCPPLKSGVITPEIIDSRRVGPNSIFLSWGPDSGVNTFNLRYGPSNGNWLFNTDVTGFSTTINSLPANQPIWVQVAARNECQIGSYGSATLMGGSITSGSPGFPNNGGIISSRSGIPRFPDTGFAPRDKNVYWYLIGGFLFLSSIALKIKFRSRK